MVKSICQSVSVLIVVLLFTHDSRSQKDRDTSGGFPITEIDSVVDFHHTELDFSGVILMAEAGEIVYSRAVSQINLDEINLNSRFPIASITKLFTSIIILQLVEDGHLSLDETVNDWLPHFNIRSGDAITIHHLLLHISGLPNEPDDLYKEPFQPDAFVINVLPRKTSHALGTFNYANIDYVLLGLIIESVTGKPWQVVVKERILEPLEMKHSGFLSKDSVPDNLVRTYTFKQEGLFLPDPPNYIENYYAAGCMFSTANDLVKLDQAMYQESFLSGQSRSLMFRSYPEYNYSGYGVWTYRYPFVQEQPLIMERRGGILGANVVIMRLLEYQRTIIVLSNNDRFQPDSFGDPNNLREGLLRAWFNTP